MYMWCLCACIGVCVYVCEGVGTVALVILVTSLQEVCGFNSLWLSVWTVHVSPDLLFYWGHHSCCHPCQEFSCVIDWHHNVSVEMTMSLAAYSKTGTVTVWVRGATLHVGYPLHKNYKIHNVTLPKPKLKYIQQSVYTACIFNCKIKQIGKWKL